MAKPTQELIELVVREVSQSGAEARFVVGGIGQSEWPSGSQFFDNDTVLAVTDHSFIFFKPEKKGLGGRRLEVKQAASFAFADLTNPRAGDDSDGTPKMIKFTHDPQEIAFMDIWADPAWDEMVRFWAGKVLGERSSQSNDSSAAWDRVVAHMRSSYSSLEEHDEVIKLLFDVSDDRSQIALVRHDQLMDGQENWACLESPFGRTDQLAMAGLAEAIDGLVVGGVGARGDLLLYRHAVNIDTFDGELLDRCLRLVVATADRLEQQLTGGDAF